MKPSILTITYLLRKAATGGAVSLLASGVAITIAPTASAGTCTIGPPPQLIAFCGAVKNRTGRTMSITEKLGSGTDYCDVWNWNGGDDSSWSHARCIQNTIGNGTRGGNGTFTDVDAFTFANEGYHQRFYRLGKWHWRKKGVWTKVQNGEIADCGIGDNNEIWCTVLWQATPP